MHVTNTELTHHLPPPEFSPSPATHRWKLTSVFTVPLHATPNTMLPVPSCWDGLALDHAHLYQRRKKANGETNRDFLFRFSVCDDQFPMSHSM